MPVHVLHREKVAAAELSSRDGALEVAFRFIYVNYNEFSSIDFGLSETFAEK